MDEPTENSEYYAILNCARDASTEEIVRAYRKLAQVFHPDKHLDEERRKQAQESFSKVQEAYEVLSAPEKRQVYDVYGKQGLAAGGLNERCIHTMLSFKSLAGVACTTSPHDSCASRPSLDSRMITHQGQKLP